MYIVIYNIQLNLKILCSCLLYSLIGRVPLLWTHSHKYLTLGLFDGDIKRVWCYSYCII